MCRTPIAVCLFCLGAATGGHATEPVADPGRVVAVTVFQGQALVTREVSLPEGAGLVELVVTDLPDRLLPGSLYAEPGEGVEVRSVRTRVRPTADAPRQAVQELEERRRGLEQRERELQRERQLLGERANYLKQLEGFTSGSAKAELASGVLDAGTLRELTTLIFDERSDLAQRELAIDAEQRELDSEKRLVSRELQTLATGEDRDRREAVVFVNKRAGAASVRLMYLVGGASWSPSYNLRATEDGADVTVEYNASVTQMSGEDWSDVAMTLSTATPSLVATAPTLESFTIRLASARAKQKGRASKLDLSRQQRELASNRGNFSALANEAMSYASDGEADDPFGSGGYGGGGGLGGGFGAAYVDSPASVADTDRGLNRFACALQLLDLTAGSGDDKSPSPTAPENDSEGMSVVYRLPNKTSLPSRPDKQLIQIAATPLEADFYRVATPVLTGYVYQEAELVNATGRVLLAGPAATFLGDRFVGRGEVPTVSVGESFRVGLGIDESLRVSRELVEKSDRVQGGNRVARFDYRLAVENFGDEAVAVRLYDRLPTADGKAIKVTLIESDPEVDGRTEEGGRLRWEVEVPAAAKGADAVAVTYSMQLEHDKNLTLVGGPE